MLIFFGALFVIIIYIFNLNLFFKSTQSNVSLALINFFVKKWYFDKFYNQFFGLKILTLSYIFSYKNIDRGLLELFGPLIIVKAIQNYFRQTNKIQPFFFIQNLSFFFILFLYISLIFFNYIFLFQFLIPFFLLLAIVIYK